MSVRLRTLPWPRPLEFIKGVQSGVEHTVTGYATVDQPPLLPHLLFVAKDALTVLEVFLRQGLT